MNDDRIKLYSETHAIEVVNFIVRLSIPIQTSDIRRFDERIEELKDLFPAINDLPGIKIQFTPDHNQVATEAPPAKELMYFDSDGQPIWVGKFLDDQIMVSCRKYSTWEEIWPDAKHRLYALLNCVDEYKPIYSVDYSVTDTFSANKSEEILLAGSIFRDSSYLPKKMISHSDPRWDIGQGWFDSLDSVNEILVRVDAKSGIENDKVVASICNLHSQRFAESISVNDIVSSSNDTFSIEQIFSNFHHTNKELIKQILTDDLLIRMRLKEPD